MTASLGKLFALAFGVAVFSPSVAWSQTHDGVTIKWATLAPTGSLDNLRKLVSEWEEANGAKVDIVILPHPGLAEKVILDQQTGVATYDLITLNYPKLGQFADGDFILPIDDYIARSTTANIDDFIPRLVDTYGRWNGKIVGLPVHADGRIMLYRKDVFDAHGKEPARTWEEYLELARYFNGKDWDNTGATKYGAAFRFNADVISSGRFAEVYAGLGGSLLDEDWKPTIDTPAAHDTMELIKALAAVGPAGTLEMGHSEYVNSFALGQVPMLVTWAQAAAIADDETQSRVAGKVGWQTVPGGAALLGGFGLSILETSQNPQAAYDFMEWFTSAETEIKRVELDLYAVARQSTYNNPQIVDERPWYPTVADNLANGLALPRIPQADELLNVLGQETRRAAVGQISIDEAMATTQRRWEEILTKAGLYKP